MKVTGDKFRNSWTTVFIEGSWCFVNCNWGARHVKGHDKNTDAENTYFYRCDEFYFITDPEDHIYQHFPDNPKWQLLECPITISEFINLPVVKSPFFNYGMKFANHYDCTQYTSNGIVVLQFSIPNLLGFGHTLEAEGNIDPSKLEGRVMLRIIGHKAIFTVAPPKAGKFILTIYAKDDWNSQSLQSACGFRVKCRERREHIKSQYPNFSYFGPTPSLSQHGVVPQTHIDPLVSYSHDDIFIQFQLQKDINLSHSLQYYGTLNKDIRDFQRYVFIKSREEKSVSYQIRCPVSGKYVFAIYANQMCSSMLDNSGSDCLFRYIIDCKQPAKDKRPLPRACHRWYKCTLLEPYVGDVPREQTVTFRVRAPQAEDMALMAGDVWFHFHELADGIWEGTVITGKIGCKAKIYAKLSKQKARFSPLVEFQIN
ncbi:hypothetical protein FSP39_023345 [Pinctada imbricata]|uniref:KY-like immunoglobulin-like domain-containing protein n=1 Tax=Pinctada imbricata TaxID=66713 RepID=A0AA88XGT1_PINIB|nr:hypothetical protein FSP39_023345 [Pinctada imbricata]